MLSPKTMLSPEIPLDSPVAGFSVSLSNFSGPFDLLLSLIGKHELDITDISLSIVTGEFIAYLKQLDTDTELDQASEFLVPLLAPPPHMMTRRKNSVKFTSRFPATSRRSRGSTGR